MKKSQIEELFRAHYATMYRFALSMLYDEDESRDVASDVFAKVFENNITLRPDTARHYLMTAVRNRCLNIIEQKKLTRASGRTLLAQRARVQRRLRRCPPASNHGIYPRLFSRHRRRSAANEICLRHGEQRRGSSTGHKHRGCI